MIGHPTQQEFQAAEAVAAARNVLFYLKLHQLTCFGIENDKKLAPIGREDWHRKPNCVKLSGHSEVATLTRPRLDGVHRSQIKATSCWREDGGSLEPGPAPALLL
jgi:hypothetical protein